MAQGAAVPGRHTYRRSASNLNLQFVCRLYGEGCCIYGVDASEKALQKVFAQLNMKYDYTPPISGGFGLLKVSVPWTIPSCFVTGLQSFRAKTTGSNSFAAMCFVLLGKSIVHPSCSL